MRRNGYWCTSGVNLDTAVRFLDPDVRSEWKISAIWRRFPLIFEFYILNVRHISTSGLFDLLTPHVDNSHQVWSWYDHPLPNYSVFVCWYVTWPCDLDLWRFDLEQLHFWNPRPQFVYLLYNFFWATMRIKGRLLSGVTKVLDCVNFLCVTLGPWSLTV